jgi:hypothetical protein
MTVNYDSHVVFTNRAGFVWYVFVNNAQKYRLGDIIAVSA